VPATKTDLYASVKCDTSSNYATWTDIASTNESKPMNCISWYLAFAFCIWDGGRLPTEAEWNYAAAGGTDQRVYPWSVPSISTVLDDSHAVYYPGSNDAASNVGSRSPGDGKYGQADLTGNVWEWMIDKYETSYPVTCTDCANFANVDERAQRGGSFVNNASPVLLIGYRSKSRPYILSGSVGVRCARAR
jgi:formylglycine-generating enzyme